MSKIRAYSELAQFTTFEDRFEYLKLHRTVGAITFGFDRWINQVFYTSHEWRSIRDHVITRDGGCDLGIPGFELYSDLLIHHMNPVTRDDIIHGEEWITDPNYLITTSRRTHNAIHYGDDNLLPRGPVVRRSGDTKLW